MADLIVKDMCWMRNKKWVGNIFKFAKILVNKYINILPVFHIFSAIAKEYILSKEQIFESFTSIIFLNKILCKVENGVMKISQTMICLDVVWDKHELNMRCFKTF